MEPESESRQNPRRSRSEDAADGPAHALWRYLEVFGQEQFAGAQEAEDVAEDVAVAVDEVVLLQTVQHDGLGAVKQAADPVESKQHTCRNVDSSAAESSPKNKTFIPGQSTTSTADSSLRKKNA